MNPSSPHPSPQELADYAKRRLAAQDVLRISDHLAECPLCLATTARLRRMERDEASPGFEELAGEIEGTLTPAQHHVLAAKLAASPAAREALGDLQAFRAELSALPPKVHRPGRPPSGADDKIIVLPATRHRGVFALAMALAALFVALAAGWWTFARFHPAAPDLLRDAQGRPADLTALPAGLEKFVVAAARAGELPPSPASALAARRRTLSGPAIGATWRAVAPVGTVVRDPRPSLRWTPCADATAYVVYIVSRADGRVLASPTLPATQTDWSPPEALPRGAVYEWQVAALHDGEIVDRTPRPPAGEARFQILDAAHDAELTRLERQAAGYPLLLGVAYWDAGITSAAAAQFSLLTRTHARSAVARRLEQAAAGEPPPAVQPPAPTNTNGAQ